MHYTLNSGQFDPCSILSRLFDSIGAIQRRGPACCTPSAPLKLHYVDVELLPQFSIRTRSRIARFNLDQCARSFIFTIFPRSPSASLSLSSSFYSAITFIPTSHSYGNSNTLFPYALELFVWLVSSTREKQAHDASPFSDSRDTRDISLFTR